MTVHMQTLSPVTFHGYYQNCQYQKDLAIPIVGPYSPSLSWFITQSGLCIKKISVGTDCQCWDICLFWRLACFNVSID